LSDPVFYNALWVTIVFTAIVLPLTLIASLLAAVLCVRMIRGIKIFRTLFFLPVVTSLVIAGVVWTWMYQSSGPINSALSVLGLDAIPFLESSVLVLPSLAVVMMWTRFGYEMLILMAAMNEIPEELYEAARIDGAGVGRQFFGITLPMIRPDRKSTRLNSSHVSISYAGFCVKKNRKVAELPATYSSVQ